MLNIPLFQKFFFCFVFRAVGCIFGELLNNSPLFPVSETSYTFSNILLYMLIKLQKNSSKWNWKYFWLNNTTDVKVNYIKHVFLQWEELWINSKFIKCLIIKKIVMIFLWFLGREWHRTALPSVTSAGYS